MYLPERLIETQVKLLRDFKIRTDFVIPSKRPDTELVSKFSNLTRQKNIKAKEKHQNMKTAIQRLWHVRTKCVVQ